MTLAALGVALVLAILFSATSLDLLWAVKQLRWENERFALIFEIFSDARVVTSIPDHGYFTDGGGGTILYDGHRLNYQTLAEMILLTVQQDDGRRLATAALRQKLNQMAVWESEHPKPEPPLYFGLRLTELLPPWRGTQKRAEKETHQESQTIDSERVVESASRTAVRRIHHYIGSKDQYPHTLEILELGDQDKSEALDLHTDT